MFLLYFCFYYSGIAFTFVSGGGVMTDRLLVEIVSGGGGLTDRLLVVDWIYVVGCSVEGFFWFSFGLWKSLAAFVVGGVRSATVGTFLFGVSWL